MDYAMMWLIIATLFLIVELSNPGLFYALAFALGSCVAMIVATFSPDVVMHMVSFLLATVVAMVLLRRLVARKTGAYHPSSNVYALVGKKGLVLVAPTTQQLGYVKLNGEMWACRAVDQDPIDVEAEVIVVAVKGSHVIVRRSA